MGCLPTTTLGYTGAPTDSNGLVYLNARYLDPATGIFLSRDPFEGRAESAMSRNPYSYTGGNPINRTDRSGKCFDPLSFVVCAAIGIGATFAAGNAIHNAVGKFGWSNLCTYANGNPVNGVVGELAPYSQIIEIRLDADQAE
ncbi:MAG: RHS repeat-associated core domain-containing protein [Chloroflexota bacterium]